MNQRGVKAFIQFFCDTCGHATQATVYTTVGTEFVADIRCCVCASDNRIKCGVNHYPETEEQQS